MPKVLKKLAIVTYGMRKGGAERVISIVANYLAKREVEVTIYTFKSGACEYQLENNVQLVKLTEVVDASAKVPYREVIKRLSKLRREIKKTKPDVTLMLPEELSAFAVVALLGVKTAKVVSERNDPKIMPTNKVKRLLRKLFYPTVDGFIFQTNDAMSYFSERIASKGIVIHNPLSPSLETFERSNIEDIIVSVGRLEPQKNFPLLIDAFSKIAPTHESLTLKIYGEGQLREALQQKIDELELQKRIVLCGKSDHIFEDIKNAKLFVMTSNFEGMPNALMEAMALGIPSISTDAPSGGPKELITSFENGVLVPVRDEAALVEAMRTVLDDEELQKTLSKNGKLLLQSHSEEKILQCWYEYLTVIYNRRHMSEK